MDSGEVAGQGINDGVLSGRIKLDDDISFNTVSITDSEGAPDIDLNGHSLITDMIGYGSSTGGKIDGFGVITSSSGRITFDPNLRYHRGGDFYINSEISDYRFTKVNLLLNGRYSQAYSIYLGGESTNTFTGGLIVQGHRTKVILGKTGGATAIQGSVSVSYGCLEIRESNQILDTSSVRLLDGTLILEGLDKDISESFKMLHITGGGAVSTLTFGHTESINSKRFLFLDDLIIEQGTALIIDSWEKGRDFLLVKKTSKNLSDSLKRIIFQGYDPRTAHLDDYNDEYWSVSGAPEPAAYGAALVGVGLGLCFWRRRARASHSQSAQ